MCNVGDPTKMTPKDSKTEKIVVFSCDDDFHRFIDGTVNSEQCKNN
jgi:hypothetical protein